MEVVLTTIRMTLLFHPYQANHASVVETITCLHEEYGMLQESTIAEIADDLGIVVHRKVIDRTGMSGLFNINLEFTFDTLAADMLGPSIFTVIQE